jgi:hypothetical protein
MAEERAVNEQGVAIEDFGVPGQDYPVYQMEMPVDIDEGDESEEEEVEAPAAEQPESKEAKPETKEEKKEEDDEESIQIEFVQDEGEAEQEQAPQSQPEAKPEEVLSQLTGGKVKSKAELDALLTEVAELKEQTKPKYANQVAASFDEYVSKGGAPENFLRYMTLDVDKMDKPSIDAIITAKIWETPGLDEGDLRVMLEEKYHLFDTEHEDYDERKARIGRAELAEDFSRAKGKLKEIQEKHKAPEVEQAAPKVDQEELKRQSDERVKKFEPEVDRMLSDLTKVEVQLQNKGKYPIKVENPAALKGVLMEAIRSNPNLANNADGMKYLKQFAENVYVINNVPKIVMSAINTGRTMTDESWQKLRNNPSTIADKGSSVAPKQEVDLDDVITKAYESRMGRIRG